MGDELRELVTNLRKQGTGLLIEGDSLEALRRLPDECVELIYVDPPFNTGKRRRLQSIVVRGQGSGVREGRARTKGIKVREQEKTRRGFGGRTYAYNVQSDMAYADQSSREEYLHFLRERLVEARRVLKPKGSIYVHLDHHSVHYVKVMMDELFGEERFLNEIIWAYDYGGRARNRWPAKHDNILWYAKSGEWTFNREEIERIPYMAPGLVGAEKAARGKLPTDTWWMTIVPTSGSERTGYPTQKPEKLLERIISASSNPGDIVLDFFCGSGTTGVVAQQLGRKWIMVDNNPEAIRVTRERMGKDVECLVLSVE